MSRPPLHQASRTGSSRLPVFRLAAAGVAVFVVINVAWLQFHWGGTWATQALTDISGAACASIVALMSFLAWRNEAGRDRRRPWGFLALAGSFWAIGEITWTIYELVLKREVPFPSFADIGFLVGYPLAGLAMIALPAGPHELPSRVRTVLDALIVGLCVLFVGWGTVLAPIYHASTGSILEQGVGLAYPVFDLAVAAIVVFVIARTQRGRRTTLMLLGSGLLALGIADTAFAYLTISNTYASGIPTDAAWNMGYLLIALGALRHDPAAPRPQRSDASRTGVLLPYVGALTAVLVAGYRKVTDGHIDGVLFWGMISIIGLVTVRQLLTLLDNMSLTRNLETKVVERTAELAHSEARHKSLVQNSSDCVTIIDRDGVITYQSPSSARVFGYIADYVVGRPYVDLVHPEDKAAAKAYLDRFTSRPGTTPVVEWRVADVDGKWLFCESIGANLLDDPTVGGFVLNTRDISERKALELQLRHEAFHDQLTGSANRALFRDRADHALRRAARERKPVAVLYCDLDNLKDVNDRYGHAVGDALLAEAAARFASCIRAEDTVARIGGDEFAILLIDSGGEGAAKHVAGRLLESLKEPFEVEGHMISTTASVGIALSWGRQEVDELLRNADLAMYAAKNGGKSRYELFEPTTHVGGMAGLSPQPTERPSR